MWSGYWHCLFFFFSRLCRRLPCVVEGRQNVISPTAVCANAGSFMSVISGRMVSLSIMGGEGASALRSPVFLRFVWYRYSGLVAKIMVFCLKQKHYHEKYIPRRHFFFHDTCSLHYDIYGVRLAENEITPKVFCFLLPEFISK